VLGGARGCRRDRERVQDENPERSPYVKDFLRENWIYIVAPVVIILIVIVVLIFTGGTDSPFTYNIF
jgi:hypothetical protein